MSLQHNDMMYTSCCTGNRISYLELNLLVKLVYFAVLGGQEGFTKSPYLAEKSKLLVLLFALESVLLKWAYFWKKAKGLTLLFAEKSVFLKCAYFWKKAKGLTLLFAEKSVLLKWA